MLTAPHRQIVDGINGAEIIPFPARRRRAFLEKNGRHAAGYRSEAAENYLNGLVSRHRERLIRLGVNQDAIAVDIENLRSALQAQCARYRRLRYNP
jgi:hypothetical protein